jgi:hypothetical protein
MDRDLIWTSLFAVLNFRVQSELNSSVFAITGKD